VTHGVSSATTVTDTRRSARLVWQTVTLCGAHSETAAARTLTFKAPCWAGHLAGQHVDVRLTAPDGYAAERSYSIASSSQAGQLDLTVQRVEDGEVSPYLVDDMRIGDQLELRGPIGGWFAWRPDEPEALLLVAGGSGVAPLMAMIRERDQHAVDIPFRLIYSVRTPQDVFYADELAARARAGSDLSVSLIYTRAAPPDANRPVGRLQAMDLVDTTWSKDRPIRSYVCGPTNFVEAAATLLENAGQRPDTIRTERFGPTGGN
jgi:ferredoxin-NADP reductase